MAATILNTTRAVEMHASLVSSRNLCGPTAGVPVHDLTVAKPTFANAAADPWPILVAPPLAFRHSWQVPDVLPFSPVQVRVFNSLAEFEAHDGFSMLIWFWQNQIEDKAGPVGGLWMTARETLVTRSLIGPLQLGT